MANRYWDEAWSIVEGCAHVSPACDHCWSESATAMRACQRNPKIAARYGGLTDAGRFNGTVRLMESDLDKPLRRKKPTRYAVWNDLFHEDVPDEFIDRALAVMALCPRHTFIVLTKRSRRMMEYLQGCFVPGWQQLPPKNLNEDTSQDDRHLFPDRIYNIAKHAAIAPFKVRSSWPLPNLWLGVTCESNDYLSRVEDLCNTPAAVRLVSYEPALGPLEIPPASIAKLHWVICGGETGPGARPMHPAWVRGVRDQCQAAGVSFYFKQWGEWVPKSQTSEPCPKEWGVINRSGEYFSRTTPWNGHDDDAVGDEAYVFSVSKSRAGAIIDGREWRELPEAAR